MRKRAHFMPNVMARFQNGFGLDVRDRDCNRSAAAADGCRRHESCLNHLHEVSPWVHGTSRRSRWTNHAQWNSIPVIAVGIRLRDKRHFRMLLQSSIPQFRYENNKEDHPKHLLTPSLTAPQCSKTQNQHCCCSLRWGSRQQRDQSLQT